MFSLSFIITLIVIEVFLQTSEVSSVSVSRNDDTLGLALKPNIKLIFFNEGFHIGETNKYGYYGPAYSPEKDSNVIRICLVGDSYVESHQLFDRNSFRCLLESELSLITGKQTQVLNFGMSGFNLIDDYCYYENFVKKFHPDFTLFFVSNDDFSTSRTSESRPYCYIENDSLIISYDFRKNSNFIHKQKTAWFRGKSIILSWISKTKEIINTGLLPSILFDKFYLRLSKSKTNNNVTAQEITKIDPVVEKILTHLSQSSNIYLVEKEPLPNKINKISKEAGIKIIELGLTDDNLHYWPVTNTYGHWNFEGHILISKELSVSLIELSH